MQGAETYVDEWLAIEPGAAIAMRFCAPEGRALFGLWGALQLQLDTTRFDLAEPTVAQAKLGWWSDELRHAARGSARHPVLRALCEQGVAQRVEARAWSALADAALIEAVDESTPVDLDASIAMDAGYAACVAGIESALFGAETSPESVAIEQWLRLGRGAAVGGKSRRRWPMQLLARHQIVAEEMTLRPLSAAGRDLLIDVASQLEPRLALADRGGFWRRWRTSRSRWQVREWARGRIDATAPSPVRTLWSTWQAARAAQAAKA
jgi:hypothetical protein